MLGIVYFGVKQIPIGVCELLIKCPSCVTHSWADVMVISKYYHLFLIPIFPIAKEVNIICKKCGMKRYGIPLNSNLVTNYQEIKNDFHHPWFTYLGMSIAIIVAITLIVIKIV